MNARLRARVRYSKRGFTLVELMIVVAIVGVLAALAVYGVSRYINSAKYTEAKDLLGRIGKDAIASYLTEKGSTDVQDAGASSTSGKDFCPSGAAVPTALTSVKGIKYQSKKEDWSGGWACLRFSVEQPQYFQYEYTHTAGANDFTATAAGDLDGDGTRDALFTYKGGLNNENVPTLAPAIAEDFSQGTASADDGGDADGSTGDGT